MIKVNVTNIYGQTWKPEFASLNEANLWIEFHTANNTFGKPARWLPDFLEGAETRVVVFQPASEKTSEVYNESYEVIGTEIVSIPELSHTEYLHPAEYTYEIVEEDLDVIKARKLAELSAISKQKNPYLDLQNLGYRMMNVQSGKYAKEGKQSKADAYLADYNAVSDSLANEYIRCENLINNAVTEQEILAVTFNL